MISRRRFLHHLDAAAVTQAIADVETRTSGEIRVSIAGFFLGNPRRVAARAFRRLRMDATARRNGVLIFVAPARRQVVVLGDEAIHARVGDAFWADVALQLGLLFREGRYTAGLVEGVRTIGDVLARHFPLGAADNPNELPDAIDAGAH